MHRIKHKQPFSNEPSPFVLSCIKSRHIKNYGNALDLACGYGRHTYLLNTHGYSVISGDISIDGLRVIKQETPQEACCINLDATKNLPFKDNTFDLVLAVHYVDDGLLTRMASLIKLDGYLIYETYGGQGENWRTLPKKGEVADVLSSQFTILKLRESFVGPKLNQHVSVKVFARKIHN